MGSALAVYAFDADGEKGFVLYTAARGGMLLYF
jgi:hypothetical protein